MPASERSPLLSAENETDPTNQAESSENAPLLANDQPDEDEVRPQERQPSSWTLWPLRKQTGPSTTKSSKWRWPSIIAGIVLAILVVLVLLGGFLVPGAVKQYAEGAAVIEPKALSVESITSDGVRARIQANFRLDGSRVENDDARRIGRFTTGIMRKLETEETKVDVLLPNYDNSLLGSAVIPPITVDIRDGHSTDIDIVTDLLPGDAENLRKIANQWLEGKLDQLKVTGAAKIKVKSGIFPLGAHDVVESMIFEASKIPSIPEYHIEQISFQDVPMGRNGRKAVGANVSLSIHNAYPVALDVPPLGFEILLANCDESDPFITVAEAVTEVIEVHPDSEVHAGALGIIREIPKDLTRSCPKSKMSPLDVFMEHYLHGEDAEIFVRGSSVEDSDTPEWVEDILKSIVVPIEFPGQSFGDAIKNFSATDVNFQLPSPFADPNDPDGVPRVSGTILVIAALPDELNLDLGVHSIKSNADLFYKGDKLGELNMREWNDANSTIFTDANETMINITSRVIDIPLDVTDNDVFTDIMQKMFFGSDDIILDVKASVDVQVGTVLGDLALKGIPANGSIPVKTMPKNTFRALEPQVDDIRILKTSETGVKMQARVNFTNPTPYTAFVPELNVHLLSHGQVLGEATATNIILELGNNTGNIIEATWDPLKYSGRYGHKTARKLLSEYLSGKNTTLTIRTHSGSIPTMPALGEALSKINITIPTPHLKLPGNEDDNTAGDSRFIRDATFHLFSSTATFTLASPLQYNTVYLQAVNATAYYNHTEPIGRIITDQAFPVTPGLSTTPKLPVDWSLGSVGYGKLKEALGGRLKLDAVADVTVRVGNWVEEIHYTGKGIGAKVSL